MLHIAYSAAGRAWLRQSFQHLHSGGNVNTLQFNKATTQLPHLGHFWTTKPLPPHLLKLFGSGSAAVYSVVCSVRCVQCGVCTVWDVYSVGCVQCEVCTVWGVYSVRCVQCGVCTVWGVQCGVCTVWDVWGVYSVGCVQCGVCTVWGVYSVRCVQCGVCTV